MLRYLPFLLVLALWIYTFIDCLTTPEDKVRNLPKVMWVIIVLLFGQVLIGPIAWLIAGRPRGAAVLRQGGTPGESRLRASRPRFVAPDDNPEFLKSLDEAARSARENAEREGEPEDGKADRGGSRAEPDADGPATPGAGGNPEDDRKKD